MLFRGRFSRIESVCREILFSKESNGMRLQTFLLEERHEKQDCLLWNDLDRINLFYSQ